MYKMKKEKKYIKGFMYGEGYGTLTMYERNREILEELTLTQKQQQESNLQRRFLDK